MTNDEVRHIADLAKLSFNNNEIEQFIAQFSQIIQYISMIDNLQLEGIDAEANLYGWKNAFREDYVKPSLSKEESLSNAPKRNEVFFKVPKMLE
ncbi:MAG TPA: Asp-tRNA(Asn)/Glu-tRNA(Gln) amidotransferase subunit GatB [Bacteroidetes bacterium]|nr:Asp-tRNA(Asn)/Glu-tRNA(Gln) amidotransferase subunit GatB [Bacteroidota bacterium]